MEQVQVTLPDDLDVSRLVGVNDSLLRLIESAFDARIVLRNHRIDLVGDEIEVKMLTELFADLIALAERNQVIETDDLLRTIELIRHGQLAPSVLREDVLLTHRGKTIRAKTAGQKRYVDAIRNNSITFAIGPAGTGKTYLAVALAIEALRNKEVSHLILTRPVVEAGEHLGYLPGTLNEKIDPYIRPLYDALFDMSDMEKTTQQIDRGIIEIAPLAYMRGRTLNDSFIILDEAQNTTSNQMKMFLTRLGFGSKMVITGDITQLDLPRRSSGLLAVRRILAGLDDVAFVELTGKDVVRNSLVQRIVAAYDQAEDDSADDPQPAFGDVADDLLISGN